MSTAERAVALSNLAVAQVVRVMVSSSYRRWPAGLSAGAQAIAYVRHLSRLTRGSRDRVELNLVRHTDDAVGAAD